MGKAVGLRRGIDQDVVGAAASPVAASQNACGHEVGDVTRGGLEVVDVSPGFEDLHDFDIGSADLLGEIGEDGMERGDFHCRASKSWSQEKSNEDRFHDEEETKV